MKISEFVFHGVPQGFDVWGTSGDKYYESFYNILESFKGAKSAFVVEIRKDSNKWCSYYSYVRAQNVIAEGGRTGSYFGMSLKMDGEYCTDVYSLFQLMETIYEQKISGKIIAQSGSNEKYVIASFSNADLGLKEISDVAITQIRSNFENDFEAINITATKPNASISLYYNINDVNSETFFNAVKSYGKIFISQIYPSKDAIINGLTSSDKKYQAIKAEYEEQISLLKKDNQQISGLKGTVTSLSQELEHTKAIVKSLSEEKNSLQGSSVSLKQELNATKQENEKLKKLSNVGAVAEKLEPSVNEMLGLLRAVKPNGYQHKHEDYGNDNYGRRDNGNHGHYRYFSGEDGLDWKKYIPFIIALVAIIVAIFFFIKGIKSGPEISGLKKDKEELTQTITELQSQVASLNKECVQLKDDLRVVQESSASPKGVVAIFFDPVENKEIKNLSSLKVGKPYKVRITGVNSGEWKVDGFVMTGNKKGTETLIEPEKKGVAYLSYYVNGNKVYTQKFKIE